MKPFESEKGKIDALNLSGPVPIIRPRLIRAVPANIARVIENFEAVQSTVSFEENNQ